MERNATVGSATAGTSEGDGRPWYYLVALPAAELPVAALAPGSTRAFGPTHSVTAALGVFLLYATPVVGAASLAGLILDGRRGCSAWWYAGVAVALAAALTYHGAEEGALSSLWEPTVELALAMVPVGSVHFLGRRASADRGL